MNIDGAIRKAQHLGASYCDIRTVQGGGTTLSYRDGELYKAISGGDRGAGIRVLYGGNWGFYAVDGKMSLSRGVERAVKLARTLASRKKGKVKLAPCPVVKDSLPLRVTRDPREVDLLWKVELLEDLMATFNDYTEINSVEVGLDDGVVKNHFYSSEGSELSFYESSVLVRASLTARDGTDVVGYRMRLGGAAGYEILDGDILMEKAEEAALSTIRLLGARSAPSGKYTVIADPDLAGVFAHEAVGHATEADLVLSGDSILKGEIGNKIGSDFVTIFDDPSIPGGFGSFPYDDEGVKARKKMLIEGGILMGFLHSRETSGEMDDVSNGSARSQSAGSPPLVRMSNTMIGNGEMSFEELIEDIHYGVYLMGTRGGQVDTAKGMFQFNAAEGYLIEKGKLTSPFKDVSLSGSTLDTLKNIDALANDFRLGSPGFCGKGQLVSVCDGGPHIRIRDAVVGGR